MKKAIFLDRDGTINEFSSDKKSQSPKTIKDLKFKKNIFNISKYLKKKNYLLIMVTNQPDVSRKINTKKNVNKINILIQKKIKLDDIFVCFGKDDKNYRRKPNPGMLYEAKKKWNIDFKKSFFIGDSLKDMIAGNKVGTKTILFTNKKNKKLIDNKDDDYIDYRINFLKEIYKIIK